MAEEKDKVTLSRPVAIGIGSVGGLGTLAAILSATMDMNASYYSRMEGQLLEKRVAVIETSVNELRSELKEAETRLSGDVRMVERSLKNDFESDIQKSTNLILNRLDQVTNRLIDTLKHSDSALEKRIEILERKQENER